jgi:hypothetical protein
MAPPFVLFGDPSPSRRAAAISSPVDAMLWSET